MQILSPKSTGREVYKMQDDTIKLLRECNAGIKMGVSSLDEVMEHVHDEKLGDLLAKSKETHTKLGNMTHEYLNEFHDEGKEPAMMAKMMSWVKTNVKLGGDDSDSMVADLITDGCNMGIKSLHKYLNQYPAADEKIKKLAKEVAKAEETLVVDLRPYL